MRACVACGEPLNGPGVFRIRIGGVTYDEQHGALFIQERCDSFRDGSMTQWLCVRCANQHGVYVDDLEDDVCGAVDGRSSCGGTFEPIESEQSETVLRLEWGTVMENISGKGPGETFVVQKDEDGDLIGGHIHFICACDAWRIPLWDIEPADTP